MMKNINNYITEKLKISKDIVIKNDELINTMINIITSNKKYQENKTNETENDIYEVISNWIDANNIENISLNYLDFDYKNQYDWKDILKKANFDNDIINKLTYHSCHWGWNNTNTVKTFYLGKTKRNYYSFIEDMGGNKAYNLPRLTVFISYNYTDIKIGFIKKNKN